MDINSDIEVKIEWYPDSHEWLNNMSTDTLPADFKIVARSFARKNKKLMRKNNHLFCLLKERHKDLRRISRREKKISHRLDIVQFCLDLCAERVLELEKIEQELLDDIGVGKL